MKNRSALFVVTSLAAAALLAGCSSQGSSPTSATTGTESSSKEIIVGVSGAQAPYTYKADGTQEWEGFNIDLLSYVLTKAGYTPVYEEMAFEALIPALDTGRADITVSLYDTPSRAGTLDFVDFYEAPFGVVTVANDAGPVDNWSDICGKQLASLFASTIADTITAANAEDCPADNPVINTTFSGSIATVLQAVKNGRTFGAIDDVGIWQHAAKLDPSLTVVLDRVGDPYKWAVGAKKGSTILQELQPYIEEWNASEDAKASAEKYGMDPAMITGQSE